MTKVLIIEDDPLIATIYRSYLEKSGFQVEVASDGQTGFYRVHELRPDALLLDLMLPKMDGLQILRKIRAQKAFVKTPVLVFTNAFLPNMVEEAVQAGATQVYNKAEVTPRHMVDALNKALFPSALPGSGVTAAAMAAMQMAAAAAAVPEPPPPMLTMVGQKPPPPPPPTTPSPAPVRPPPPVPSGMVMPTVSTGRTEPPKPPRGVIPFPMAPVPPPPAAPAPAPAAKLPPPPSLPEESEAADQEMIPYAAPSLAAAPLPPRAVPPPAPAPAPIRVAAPKPPASPAGFSEDEEFLAELRDTFRAGLSGQLTLLRKTLQELAASSPGDASRQQMFSELYRRVHSLAGGAGMVGLGTVAQLGTPLEALLRELCEKPKHPTPSILRTLDQAGHLMVNLLAGGEERNWLDSPAIEILAVDDEPISQRAIAYALKKAQLKCEIIEEVQAVGPWLAAHRCDLLVVGADVPGLNLAELSVQWRAAQPAPKTPVLHVVSPADLEGRLRTCAPGDDCLAKPFLFVEMSVKALTMILGQRMARAGA